VLPLHNRAITLLHQSTSFRRLPAIGLGGNQFGTTTEAYGYVLAFKFATSPLSGGYGRCPTLAAVLFAQLPLFRRNQMEKAARLVCRAAISRTSLMDYAAALRPGSLLDHRRGSGTVEE
jgi:hypothetical protein